MVLFDEYTGWLGSFGSPDDGAVMAFLSLLLCNGWIYEYASSVDEYNLLKIRATFPILSTCGMARVGEWNMVYI